MGELETRGTTAAHLCFTGVIFVCVVEEEGGSGASHPLHWLAEAWHQSQGVRQ